jgi:hypothetical protein
MKYNNTHKITTTIQKITTTIQKKQINNNYAQDHLRLATIHTRRIRILPNEQKVTAGTRVYCLNIYCDACVKSAVFRRVRKIANSDY